jgi:hypothetical protein
VRAQSIPIVDRPLIVKEISIEGNKAISTEEIKAVIHTRIGDQLDRELVLNDLRAISRTGHFNDLSVNVYPKLTQGGIHLSFGVGEIDTWLRYCSITVQSRPFCIERTFSHSRWPVYNKWPRLYGFWLSRHRFDPAQIEQLNSELLQFDRKFGHAFLHRFPKSPWICRAVSVVTEKSVVVDAYNRFVLCPTHFESVIDPDPNIVAELPDKLGGLTNSVVMENKDKSYGPFTVDAGLVLIPQNYELRFVQYTGASK